MTKTHRSPSPTPDTHHADLSAAPPVPGAGTLAVLALAWLLAMLSSARQAVGSSAGADPSAVTRAAAALELPQVISASLIAGVAVGLAAGNLLSRFGRAAFSRGAARFAVGAAAGLVTGLAVATPILLRYGGLPSIQVLGGAVATAAALGGLLAGLRHGTVIAAGACGAMAVFIVGLFERIFEGNLRLLFGASESTESVVTASGWVALLTSVMAGTAAGVLGYAYLRRSGPAHLRWPAYLVAGAMPGLLVLLAEAVTRLGGARLFQLVSASSAGDQAIMSYFHAARLNRALIVLFVGALVAIFLLGRSLPPASAAEPAGDAASDPAADAGAGAERPQRS